jgi:hypothetical protein
MTTNNPLLALFVTALSTRTVWNCLLIRKNNPPRGKYPDIKYAYIEHVAAMGGQGVTSMFRFGQNFGQWQGILGGLRIPTGLVRPQAWKKYHELIGTDKNASLELARELFPDNLASFRLKKHDGMAEASLIAKYAWELKEHTLLTCPIT